MPAKFPERVKSRVTKSYLTGRVSMGQIAEDENLRVRDVCAILKEGRVKVIYSRRPRFADLDGLREECQVTPGGCWLWLGSADGQGYGIVSWKGKRFRVHRLALILLGYKLKSGEPVSHIELCEGTACCNPAHLERGEQAWRDRIQYSALKRAERLKQEKQKRKPKTKPKTKPKHKAERKPKAKAIAPVLVIASRATEDEQETVQERARDEEE